MFYFFVLSDNLFVAYAVVFQKRLFLAFIIFALH